jgi:maleate isomerase
MDVKARPIETFPVEFDGGYGARASIGFIVLPTERTIERDMTRLMPAGVNAMFTRVPREPKVTVDTLRAIGPSLETAASLFLPDDRVDVVTYACTSGSLILGEDVVIDLLRRGAPNATHATTLITSVIRAMRALGLQRISVATAYIDEINDLEARYLEERGFQIVNIRGLRLLYDHEICSVAPQSLKKFAGDVYQPEADGLFISCGGLRTFDIIEDLEAEIGKPIVTSNQAMLWDVLRLAGIDDRFQRYGRLLREL